MLLAFDFGDAPTPYPTTLAENGARHEAAGPQLGASRDTEGNGSHSTSATGDGADEDGLTFGSLRVGQTAATVTVHVQNAPAGAQLDAWLDLNADGAWGGPGEQIANSLALVNGNNSITVDVPSWAWIGQTFARFRLSTTGGLGTRGAAVDGEVEDYAVSLGAPGAASGIFDATQLISNAVSGAYSVFAADVDGDGDMDVLSASAYDDRIAWHENDGSQSFTRHNVNSPDPDADPGNTINGNADGARSVFAADVDGDGDMDVLSASAYDDRIAWYENDGSQSFTQRNVNTPDTDGNPSNPINGNANGARSVYAADVDGDGDVDVLSASAYDNKIAWYDNNGSQVFTPRTISMAANGAHCVIAADVDGDGDMDVLSASAYDNKIAWYDNNGSQIFTPRTISLAAESARSVFTADLDRDGDLDVLSASAYDNKVAWYENNGSQIFTPHIISTAVKGVRSVFVADVDGDSDMDVLSVSAYDYKVVWFENTGNQVFTPHTISGLAEGARSAIAADIDGDGDLDVVSASGYDNKVAWYEQVGFDLGDAPLPFVTTLAENGARHARIGPMLGTARDEEADGTHSLAADADDIIGVSDDEDGIVFNSSLVPGSSATVSTLVSAAARLDAWIDFNGDGDWSDMGEQVSSSQTLLPGEQQLTFPVPASAAIGMTYGRFRLSTTGGLSPAGPAPDGEVEDYQVEVQLPTGVVGRHIFYNNSIWDGTNMAANANDDAAIAADKAPLLPGQIATFANYTSYSKGINGLMIDVANLPGVPTASDFVFKAGNVNNTATWTAVTTLPSVALRPGAGTSGSTRVTLTWPDGTISKRWLQVTMLANATTGLSSPDVFYYGNAIGEAGNSPTDAQVNAADELLARGNPRNIANPAPLTFPYDYNRDKQVNAADQLIARGNPTNLATRLILITPPVVAGPAAAALDEREVAHVKAGLAAAADGLFADVAIVPEPLRKHRAAR